MDRMQSVLEARKVSEALDMPWQLPRHATIVNWIVTDDRVAVSLEIFEVKETNREDKFTKKGIRLLNWTKNLSARNGWDYSIMTVWDEDFEPYSELKIGKIESPAEYIARREWEGMQYRVGTSHSPMDSASRVTEGY